MATIVYKQDINLQRAIDDIVDLFKNNKLYSKKIADILTKHTKTLKFILNDFSDTPYISKNIWTEPVYINWDDGIVTEYKNFVDKDRLSEVPNRSFCSYQHTYEYPCYTIKRCCYRVLFESCQYLTTHQYSYILIVVLLSIVEYVIF